MRSRCRCSMCPAIHINSRSWLRSSSTHEPSDPPLRVVFSLNISFYRSAGIGNELRRVDRRKGSVPATRFPFLFLSFWKSRVWCVGNNGIAGRRETLFEPSPNLSGGGGGVKAGRE